MEPLTIFEEEEWKLFILISSQTLNCNCEFTEHAVITDRKSAQDVSNVCIVFLCLGELKTIIHSVRQMCILSIIIIVFASEVEESWLTFTNRLHFFSLSTSNLADVVKKRDSYSWLWPYRVSFYTLCYLTL